MQYSLATLPGFDRFSFCAEALDASGGFKPTVQYLTDENYLSKPNQVTGPCYLIPYPRESMAKFAGRVAVAVYENHLRSACERFVGYITAKPPHREGTDGPLTQKFIENADWAGNALDVFWQSFMIDAKARGSMLLLVDMPETLPTSLAEQAESRAVPYIVAIPPERVCGYELDPSGQFLSVGIRDCMTISGKEKQVVREWNATGWRILDGDTIIDEGTHPFKRCPVLALTEYGKFPCHGNFQQIANLSRRIFNAQSELDEILRSQTFSLLTYQVPAEIATTFDAAKVAAVIGTHNMLTHSGATPEFIAPGDGPAKVYMERIAGLEAAVKRIALEIDDSTRQLAESGIAKAIRFQSLNSALSSFALRMQDFERQVFDLVSTAIGTENRVDTTWPTDFTLADPTAELDKLALMQSGGFSDAVLIEKRKQITQAEFSSLDQDSLQELLDSLDEPAAQVDPNSPGGATGTDPNSANPPAGDPARPGDPSTP